MYYEYEKKRAATIRAINDKQNTENKFVNVTENDVNNEMNKTNFEFLVLNGDEYEKIENLISYYNIHGIERILNERPDFIVEDFTELLKTLERIIEV